jgi:hypothetical protein
MEVRVKSAYMTVDDEGMAEDVFHLTTLSGNKLSDERVKDIVERVRAFVMFCQPTSHKVAVEWRNGPVLVSNRAHETDTLMTIIEAKKRAGARRAARSMRSCFHQTLYPDCTAAAISWSAAHPASPASSVRCPHHVLA